MKEKLLEIIRNTDLPTKDFRQYSLQLSYLMAEDIRNDFENKDSIILVSILRAGIALLPAFVEYFPLAKIGFFGIRREETAALPQKYYENLPALSSNDYILLLDPMIATAGSAIMALSILKEKGAVMNKTHLIGILAAKKGIKAVNEKFPKVKIQTVAIDAQLDHRKFILPGLGDFGDRFFGT